MKIMRNFNVVIDIEAIYTERLFTMRSNKKPLEEEA